MKKFRKLTGQLLQLVIVICSLISSTGAFNVKAQSNNTPLPLVAIHVSELTQQLESLSAVPPTPTGTGTTGFQWWSNAWHYHVMYESLKEALRSDGTPFIEITDADISDGRLLNIDGSIRYPILISLASEAVRDDELNPLRNYVSAGGFLFVGSSAFTRNPDGTTRGDFALANEMGIHTVNSSLQNWYMNGTFTKIIDNRLTSHIPIGTLNWRMPATSEQIPVGTVPNHPNHLVHYTWQIDAADAEVLATGDSGPLLTLKSHGEGMIFYHGDMQPLIGYGGADSSMYTYVIYRRAIEWAFESANLPIIKLNPWRYQYDAAFIVRHDFENTTSLIQGIEQSAQVEQLLGARADYYFCTGTIALGSDDLRLSASEKSAIISSLQRAVSLNGATIGSHNGGLPNPVDNTIPFYAYDFYHWGPDEALDVNPPGYTSGKDYAQASIGISFNDIEGWLSGYDNGRSGCGTNGNCPRTFVAPYYNGARNDSIDVLAQLGVITAGEQKLGAFPHWTLSVGAEDKLHPIVSLPISEWYQGIWYGTNNTAQALENHTATTLREAIDFYYSLGGLINIYSHSITSDSGLTADYINYSLSKNNIWSTNAVSIYDWWQNRSAVVVTPSYSYSGLTSTASATISGAVDPDTAIDIVIPGWSGGQTTIQQVLFNGVPANPADYRQTVSGLRLRVGTSTTLITVDYGLSTPPTSTSTPLPPTPTATNTPVLPTATPTPTSTNTPVPATFTPTATNTPVPPTATPTLPSGGGEETGNFTVNGTPGWSYRLRLWIDNSNIGALPASYSVRLGINTSSLVTAGKMRADGNDLRIVREGGSGGQELDRVSETSWNSTNTDVWFKTQDSIPGNGRDASYYIYYGNPTAGAPPANPSNVYAMWEGFDGSTLNSALWQVTAGSVAVSGGIASLPAYSNILGTNTYTNTLLEMRLRLGGENSYAWWGWETSPVNANDYLVFEETFTQFGAFRTAGGAAGPTISLPEQGSSLTNWHTYTVDWWMGNAAWYVDGAQVGSATTVIPTVGMRANLYAYYLPMDIDWVKARLRVPVEPVVSLSTSSSSTPTPTITNSPVPPTSTPISTNTPVLPTFTPTSTNSPVLPTSTPTATNTPVPPTTTPTPTSTNTPVPATSTPTLTNTPVPPTATPTPTSTSTPLPPTPTATNTPVPPTATPTPTSTSTPLPPTPTATNTPVPPTATPTPTSTSTPLPPTPTATNTPVLPTATPTPTSTNTPVPATFTPTATNTPVPPTATPTLPSGGGEETGNFTVNGTPGWSYRLRLWIDNSNIGALPASYSVRLGINTSSLVTAGKMRADGNDLRIVREGGSGGQELDRVSETSWNSTNTDVWFKTQDSIPGNGRDASYYIYYGNPTAGAPPANPSNVYAMWEGFDGSTLNSALWQVTAGSVAVSGGIASLPAYSNILGTNTYTNTLLEMRLRLGGENSYAWWGWETSPVNANDYLVFEETFTQFGAFRTAGGAAGPTISLPEQGSSLTNWHTYTVDWWMGNAAWYVDGAQVGSATTVIPTVGMRANLYAYYLPMDIDWVKARLRVPVEPVVSLSTN